MFDKITPAAVIAILAVGGCSPKEARFCNTDSAEYSDNHGTYEFEPSDAKVDSFRGRSQIGNEAEFVTDDGSMRIERGYFVMGGIFSIPIDIEQRREWVAFNAACTSRPVQAVQGAFAIQCKHVDVPERSTVQILYSPKIGITELQGAKLSSRFGIGRRC